MPTGRRETWKHYAVAAVSVLATYLVLEIGYRAYQYRTLPDRLFKAASAEVPAAPNPGAGTVYDAYTGYRYSPNFDGQLGPPTNGRWHTNSHGHVSQFDYPLQKPPGEYRIAVIGDSFTANIHNRVRWTELVESRLNASGEWRASVADRFTRVINFGVDGTGMVQFAAMARHHALAFDPDLIIVNFISEDIFRRLRYLSRPPPTRDRDAAIRAYLRVNFIDRIDWFSLQPELFAATVGRLWAMPSGLPVDARSVLASRPDWTFRRRQDAIDASAAAVRDILALERPVLFLHAPTVEELDGDPPAKWIGLIESLQRVVPALKVVSMQPAMEALLDVLALKEPHKLELNRWFYVPEDSHFTDYGTTLYGGQVASYLIAHAGSWPLPLSER